MRPITLEKALEQAEVAQQPGQLGHAREGAASRERTGAMELLLSGGLALGRTPVEGWGSARSQRLLRAHGGGQAQATRRTKPRAPPRRALSPWPCASLTAGQEQSPSQSVAAFATERHRASPHSVAFHIYILRSVAAATRSRGYA